MDLRNEIQKIAIEFSGYGYRRVTMELHRRGYKANHKHVLRIMEADNLLCIKKKFIPRTTDSDLSFRVYPNLTEGRDIININQL